MRPGRVYLLGDGCFVGASCSLLVGGGWWVPCRWTRYDDVYDDVSDMMMCMMMCLICNPQPPRRVHPCHNRSRRAACTPAIRRCFKVPWSVPPSGAAREPSGPGGALSYLLSLLSFVHRGVK